LDTQPQTALIIGAGFAGIAAAIKLREAGIDDFIIAEKTGGISGTWYDNTYPGAACDVPSHLYSYSFALNPNWSRRFSPSDEIRGYVEDVVKRYDLEKHIRPHTEILSAVFDEATALWHAKTKGGESFTARFLVASVAILGTPQLPDIAGMDSFQGTQFHSARWDNSVDLKGKRIAVIGSAASTIQIAPAIATDIIEKEIDFLNKNNATLFSSKNYKIYFTDSKPIKNILLEIGRLREITFREVGEGTNKSVDLDKYDYFFKHLFLWDVINKKLVGAYRMGLGKDIYKKHGIRGFYINELFQFEPELFDMMEKTIELGRAFIIKEYQQKPMPLFLLWKGVIHVTLRYPEYKYLMGGVSISNKFSNFSKSLMIEFMKSHYYDPFIAQYVHPKKEYKVILKDVDKDFVFDTAKADMNKFDKIIDEIEPGNLRLPVLLKKYVKQNAKLVAFNVDPKFNNAVDGLMYLRISDLPESTVKPVMEEFQTELEQRHNSEK